MKEKNVRIVFFIIVICIMLFSIYYVLKNKKILAKDNLIKKQEEIIDNNIILGITNFDTLNPILSKNQDVQYVTKLIYEPLINITKDFRLDQGLIKQWAQINDKTYLLLLNNEKKWQDGNRFGAKDVEYAINYIKEQESSIYYENVKNIDKIEIINDYTIKIHLFEKEEDFEYMLSFPIICEKENIGTGKYKITNINENIIALTNSKSNKKITIKNYDSITDLYNAFNKKDVDIITTQNINYKNYLGEMGYNTVKIYGRNFEYLKFNLDSKIFNNPEVLQAISFLINKQEIVYKIFNNSFLPGEFPLQYGSYLYQDNINYEYNVNKALKILEKAGWIYNRFLLEKR